MDIALVRLSHPQRAASSARWAGQVAVVGVITVVLATAGVVVLRSTGTVRPTATIGVEPNSGDGASLWAHFPFHLFPPQSKAGLDRFYRSYAAMRRERLAGAQPAPGADLTAAAAPPRISAAKPDPPPSSGATSAALPSIPASPSPASIEPSILSAGAATLPPQSPDESTRQPMAFSRLVFDANAIDLPPGAAHDLEAIVQAAADSHHHVRLSAYASGDADGGNQARRMSLSRALAVRSYLIQQGIASERLEVRALGNRNAGGPEDRVDLSVGDR